MKSRADEVNIRVCDMEATLKSYLLDKKKMHEKYGKASKRDGGWNEMLNLTALPYIQ